MRHLVLVAGSGRSGTSLMTGTLGRLGFRIPQPEVEANETNPKGFGEPRWVVDFHGELLNGSYVRIADANPQARERVAPLWESPRVRMQLRDWLEAQFETNPSVVIKDPRLLWFLPLWEAVGANLGATVGVVSMLRHPAEVVRSKLSWYDQIADTEASSLAGWVNAMLEAEQRTRHLARCYVAFADLQEDWPGQIRRVGSALSLPELTEAVERERNAVDTMFDRSLHRSKATWQDLDVPSELLDVAGKVWDDLSSLVVAPEDPDTLQRLGEHRQAYDRFYTQVEQIARSSISMQVRPLKDEIRKLKESRALARQQLSLSRRRVRNLRGKLRELGSADRSARAPRSRARGILDAAVRRASGSRVRRMVPLRAWETVVRMFRG